MDWTRRAFLAAAGGSGLVYVLSYGCRLPSAGDEEPDEELEERDGPDPDFTEAAVRVRFDYRDWLVIGRDGVVTAFTGRTEMGQGLTTVLYNVLCQGLELPASRVRVVMGDTDRCPNDGPTTGSSATRVVGWGFWITCERVRQDAIALAAVALGCAAGELEYREGRVVCRSDRSRSIGLEELGDGRPRVSEVDPGEEIRLSRGYVDLGTRNVNAEAIVTGTLEYAADLYPEGCHYGGLDLPEYHAQLGRRESLDLSRTAAVPGVVMADAMRKRQVGVVGRSFGAVQRGLAGVVSEWKPPARPARLEVERELRAGAKLVEVIEKRGDVGAAIAASHRTVSETYLTQYASQVPIETHAAVADASGDRITVWVGTQAPFFDREKTARLLRVPEDKVRIIGVPVGGGFGRKAGQWVAAEAALLSRESGRPVKYIYSRKEQFQRRSRYKEAALVDLTSGLSADGRLLARKIDIYQDTGKGTKSVYAVPDVLTRLHHSKMPTRHGVMRGTSYSQVCFALESHVDSVARAARIDPVEFRRRHAALDGFRPLLDACAERIGYGAYRPPTGRGIGFAMCHHGARQLGVVAAEVAVDGRSGEVRVERLCGAYDVGLVINRNTATMGVKGAMIWGLGYALFEEVRMDGHRAYLEGLADYRIPRFSDIPPIDVSFHDNDTPGIPRGCGELPVIPTIGAIANAVADATGVRFRTLPLTPERVKAALAT